MAAGVEDNVGVVVMTENSIQWWPLPDGVVDTPMNRTELAAYFDVSVNTIDAWMRAGLPVFEEGGNGKAYTFMLSECCQWRQGSLDEEASRKASAASAIDARQKAFLNLDSGYDLGPMSAKDRKESAEADLKFNQAALMRRSLCRMPEVVELLEGIFLIVSGEAGAMPDKLERNLGLAPDQVEKVVGFMDEMQRAMVDKIAAAHLEGFEDEAEGQPQQVLI